MAVGAVFGPLGGNPWAVAISQGHGLFALETLREFTLSGEGPQSAIARFAQHAIAHSRRALGAQRTSLARSGSEATARANVRKSLNRRSFVPRTDSNLLHNRGVDRRSFLLRRIRILLVGFVAGVVLAGVTAFPLPQEATLAARLIGARAGAPGMSGWVAAVRDGLVDTNRKYPFLAYGTDWLAFGHLMIAAAFWGPLKDPVRNVFVVRWRVFCCLASVPVALVFGPLRGVPLFWLPIDCAFGLIGTVPLMVVLRDVRELERIA